MDNHSGKVMKFFLDCPLKEIHLRALARTLKISPTWAAKISQALAKQSLIISKKDKDKHLTILKADRESSHFKRLKISSNLYSLHQSGILDHLIQNYSKPEGIVLFGSYRRGEDTEESDIDLAVITTKTVHLQLNNFEKKLLRKIKIIEISPGKIEQEFMTTLANGIVLYGYLTIKK
jgi:predicted nucleotidyltransferase